MRREAGWQALRFPFLNSFAGLIIAVEFDAGGEMEGAAFTFNAAAELFGH